SAGVRDVVADAKELVPEHLDARPGERMPKAGVERIPGRIREAPEVSALRIDGLRGAVGERDARVGVHDGEQALEELRLGRVIGLRDPDVLPAREFESAVPLRE